MLWSGCINTQKDKSIGNTRERDSKRKPSEKKEWWKSFFIIVWTIKYILKACVTLWVPEKQKAVPGYQLKSQRLFKLRAESLIVECVPAGTKTTWSAFIIPCVCGPCCRLHWQVDKHVSFFEATTHLSMQMNFKLQIIDCSLTGPLSSLKRTRKDLLLF